MEECSELIYRIPGASSCIIMKHFPGKTWEESMTPKVSSKISWSQKPHKPTLRETSEQDNPLTHPQMPGGFVDYSTKLGKWLQVPKVLRYVEGKQRLKCMRSDIKMIKDSLKELHNELLNLIKPAAMYALWTVSPSRESRGGKSSTGEEDGKSKGFMKVEVDL